MRAAVITKFNEPWVVRDVPDPTPGPGQVVIQVKASGLCGTDLLVHRGVFPLQPPLVAGHEAAGVISELGPGVTDFKVGDRVGVCWNQKGCGRCGACQSALSGRCGSNATWMHHGGGNSELMLAWASGLTLIPDNVPFESAAPIFCAGYTVVSGFRNASPKPGERVAVLGVGGLGHLAIQVAKALGLQTIALTGQSSKLTELTALGADEALPVGEDPGKVLAAAGGADIILSTSSSAKQISSAFTGLRQGGRLVNLGLPDGPLSIDPMALIFGQREIRGSTQDERSDLVEALDLVSRGLLKPKIETYPLPRANDARDRLMAGKVRYRAVLLHAEA